MLSISNSMGKLWEKYNCLITIGFYRYLVYKGADDETSDAQSLAAAAEIKQSETLQTDDQQPKSGTSELNVAAGTELVEDKKTKNHFNYAARATQTVNNPNRVKANKLAVYLCSLKSGSINEYRTTT